MYYIQNPLSNRDAALDEIARRYGYEYQRRKYVETYPYINSVYGSNDIRIRELVERYGVNGAPYIPNPKTISIRNITSNGIVLPQDLNSGIARLDAVRGRSLVWNQFAPDNLGKLSGSGVTAVRNADGTYTINGTATANDNLLTRYLQFIGGHKYLLASKILSSGANTSISGVIGQIYGANIINIANNLSTQSKIGEAMNNGSAELRFHISTDNVYVNVVVSLQLFDLTLMFGAGNEPATVEEFEAMYQLPYYDYNPGTIINNNTSAIESIGFNQWDEEWEAGGLDSSGANVATPNRIRSKNYIPVCPGVAYYLNFPAAFWLYGYNGAKQVVKLGLNANGINLSGAYTIPDGCYYLRFYTPNTYGPTYNHDVCINIFNPSLNGTYKSYKKDTLTLNLSTIKGKLNGEGESVIIFPDGMKSAGTAYDYIIVDADGYARKAVKVMESVDLGRLNWLYNAENSWFFMSNGYIFHTGQFARRGSYLQTRYQPNNIGPTQLNDKEITNSNYASDTASLIIKDSAYSDAATFKAEMSGVELIYELATPQEYVLDEPIYTFFEVEKGGILRAEYNDSEQVHAPLDIDLIYSEAK